MNDPGVSRRGGGSAATRESLRVIGAPREAPGQQGQGRVLDLERLERGEQPERRRDRFDVAIDQAASAVAAARAQQVEASLELAVRALITFDGIEVATREPVGEARLATMLGDLCCQFFDYERAITFYERAINLLRVLGNAVQLPTWSVANHHLADVLLLRLRQSGPLHAIDGREPAPSAAVAAVAAEQAENLARRLIRQSPLQVVRAVEGPRILAGVLCEQGHPGAAWTLLENIRVDAGPRLSAASAGPFRLARGRCLQLLGRHEEALIELDAAIEVFDDADRSRPDVAHQVYALRVRSSVRQQVGDLSGALHDVREVAQRVWSTHRRQVGGFMDQVWSRAGAESDRRDLEAKTEDLVRTAEQDPLTGLANRRALERFFDQLPPGEAVCVVLIDVDNFKDVNDKYGHAVGDDVLREVATLLTRAVRSVDRVARWGGEEFLLALPRGSGALGSEAAQRICHRVERHPWPEMVPGLRLTVSAGVSCGPAGDLRALLLRADAAMYAAKRAGRNQVVSG